MLTLNEAIEKRLEEKRRVREEAARAKAEEEAAIRRAEQYVSDSVRRAIEKKLDCELGNDATVQATFSHVREGDDGTYYNIEIFLKAGGSIKAKQVIWVKGDVSQEQLDRKWTGFYPAGKEEDWRTLTTDNLLDALIYVRFGFDEDF